MQIVEVSQDGLKHAFNVTVPADEISRRVDSQLSTMGGQVRLPGFRPGKVPMSILRKRFGKSVLGEVLEKTVNETTTSALSERGLRPALQPKIQVVSFDEDQDLEYKLEVEVLPEVEPGDLAAIAIERPVVPVDDAMIDERVGEIAARHKSFQTVEEARPAARGDQVVIDFEGRLDGDEAPRPEMCATGHQLELGSGAFIPGFEEQLEGASVGDEKDISVTFPDDYPSDEHKGKTALFAVKVQEIRQAANSEVDDGFAKEVGFESLAALKDAIKQQIEGELGQMSRGRAKRRLLDALAEIHDFPVPDGMVDIEFETIWKEIDAARAREEERKSDPEFTPDPDLAKPEEELRAEYRAIAVRRVRLGLLLSELGRRNEIQVTQGELNTALMSEARKFPGQEKQVLEYFQQNPQAIESIRAPLYEEKVVDFIFEIAQVTDTPVTTEELMREDEELPAA